MKLRMHVAVPVTVALAALAGQSALAQTVMEGPEAVKALTTPDREATIGVTGVAGDKRRTGKYTGTNDTDAFAVLDAKGAYRDDATGTWMRFEANNLGLDSRDVRFEHERQGDWNYFVDFSQITSTNPWKFNTGLAGIGSGTQTVNGTGMRDVTLGTDRYRVKVGGGKLFDDAIKMGDVLGLKVSYRHEIKRGERNFGVRGPGDSWYFLTDPQDYLIQEAQGSVSYSIGKLHLSGGYLGSFFRNETAGVFNDAGREDMVSLPLDNQAHQVFLSGAYDVTNTTRVNGKISYSVALQNEDYTQPATLNSTTSLNGRFDTLLAQLGGTSRPIPKLTLSAKVRYENRDDKTSVNQFLSSSNDRSGLNSTFSRTTATGDFRAGYQLPMQFHLTADIKAEHWYRTHPLKRSLSYRTTTDEMSYSVGLRRMLTSTLGGSAGFTYAHRLGSDYAVDQTSAAGSNLIDPIEWADRKRYKWRLALDYAPTNDLSVQVVYEHSDDTYDGRALGPRDGSAQTVSLDGSYRLNDDWTVNGWASLNDLKRDQATHGTTVDSVSLDWVADLRHLSKAIGLGLRGRINEKWKVGGNLQHTEDVSEHNLKGLNGEEIPDLPDIRYRQSTVSAFLDYQVWDRGRVRFNYTFIHSVAKDWTWENWTYDDGTTVTIPEKEDTHFIGVSYTHKW